MIISLIGYMGSGKSTIGKSLAQKLTMDFVDMDHYIETKYQKSIAQIFKEDGEINFRKLEKATLIELLDKDNLIIATGGGTPVYYNNIEIINQKSQSIYLRLTPKQLAIRLENEIHHRPVIAHLPDLDSITEFVAKHLFERSAFYEKAQQTINGNQTEDEILKEIIPLILR